MAQQQGGLLMRKVVAVVVAGIVLFAWGAVSHMVLGLGDAGLQTVPASADASFAGLPSAGMTESGLYFFPSLAEAEQADPAAMKAWSEKVAVEPSGIVVYAPSGVIPMSPATFVIELLTDFTVAALALLLLCCAAGCCRTLGSRVLFVTLLGALTGIAHDVPFWNWYHFPTDFTVAQIVDSIIGMALVGLVLALVAGKSLDGCSENGEHAAAR
jgi:hypothetical protein